MSGVDFVQWLRDQLDEEAEVARESAEQVGDGHWEQRNARIVTVSDRDREVADYAVHECIEHIVRHDPARVLREIAAKRETVEQHIPVGDGTVCLSYCHTRTPGEHQPWPCLTLRLLALPYADHPGYRDEWKPRQLYRAGMPGVIDYREEGT